LADDALVPQDAWILSGSVRDNITFGASTGDIDVERIEQVVEACGLSPDLAGMSAGLE
jgi:ATP-binding cassette subfamily C (CFTR/MRP) protein 1